jgi:uncharacterized protein (TIGR02145 family)
MKLFLTFFLIFNFNPIFSQSKKEQIELLNIKIDSLINRINYEDSSYFENVNFKSNALKSLLSRFDSLKSIYNTEKITFESNISELKSNNAFLDRKLYDLDSNIIILLKNLENIEYQITNNTKYLNDENYEIQLTKKQITNLNDSLFNILLYLQNFEFKTNDIQKKKSINTESTFKYGSIVNIGGQNWISENLNVDVFRNGDHIPQAKSELEWKIAGENKQPAWCYFNNDSLNGKIYGKLYNWYAVIDHRGLAPLGFHIPSLTEWEKVIKYLGGVNALCNKMKSKNRWEHNGNGNNESGFNGLPGGHRANEIYGTGTFSHIGFHGHWWTLTEYSSNSSWGINLGYFDCSTIKSTNYKEYGLSVRCIKD